MHSLSLSLSHTDMYTYTIFMKERLQAGMFGNLPQSASMFMTGFHSLPPAPHKLMSTNKRLFPPVPDKLSDRDHVQRNWFLLLKIWISNDAGETTNSLLSSAFHEALSAENLCDLVYVLASFFNIMFKRCYYFICCRLSLTMCCERISATQIFMLIRRKQNSRLNRHAKFGASK